MKSNKLTKFKRTEIGMIPSDWEVVCIRDIATKVIRGSGISRDDVTEEGIDCIRYGELYTSYNTVIKKCMSHTMKDEIISPKYIKNGTIVFALTSESVEDIAKSSVYMGEDKCMIGGDICAIEHTENPVYVGYAMETKYAVNQKKFGKTKTKVVHSSTNEILNFRIAKPPKPEQEKIANALTRIDNLIEDYKKLIKKKEKIKQGLMQNLLTGKVRLKGFDTIYKTDSLGNICEIKKGKQINGNILLNNGKYYMLNGGQEPSGYLNEYNTLGNTISISEGGNSCGYVNYNKEKFWAGGHLYVVDRFKTKMDTLYFYYLLKHNESSIMQLRKGSGLPNIQKSDLINFEIYLTDDIKEQVAISQVLSNADNEINDLKIKLNKIIDIKKGMLDNLLTGRIRL